MKKGWQKQWLTAVTVKITDGSHNPPKGVAESDYLMLSSKNVFDDDLHYADPRYLTAEQYQQENKRTGVVPDDVLLTIVGTIGRSAVVPTDAPRITLQRSVAVIRPNRQFIEPRFLMYSFIERCAELNEQARGVAQKGIYLESLRELELMLPPLPEQQRIVGILDEAFEGIASAKANAEKNLQNARALFESHLQSVFTQRGEGWVKKRLGDVFAIGSSKRILETEWTSSGVPFYGGKEIVKLAKFGAVLSNSYISEEKYRDYASKYDMPRQGDILITARGTIGVGYVVQEGDKFYYKDGNIISMREKTPTNPHFMLYAFRSNAIADQLGDLAGTTVRHLPIEKAKELVLMMPGFTTQNTVVEQIRKTEGETQRLARIYERKLAALEALKKSLLHQAFSGLL